jgi:hypothetical protein
MDGVPPGLAHRGKKPAGLPVHVWRGTEIPPAVRTAIDTENLFGLGGHYRDKQAGDPMEYDDLNLVLTDAP